MDAPTDLADWSKTLRMRLQRQNRELGIRRVMQGRGDKAAAWLELLAQTGVAATLRATILRPICAFSGSASS